MFINGPHCHVWPSPLAACGTYGDVENKKMLVLIENEHLTMALAIEEE